MWVCVYHGAPSKKKIIWTWLGKDDAAGLCVYGFDKGEISFDWFRVKISIIQIGVRARISIAFHDPYTAIVIYTHRHAHEARIHSRVLT